MKKWETSDLRYVRTIQAFFRPVEIPAKKAQMQSRTASARFLLLKVILSITMCFGRKLAQFWHKKGGASFAPLVHNIEKENYLIKMTFWIFS
ncbi:hypothetical protein A2Y85_08760 [candidate division WOR-3 bacterium RBG_13_43_14]|uniref:Uncharacterized protein n=1 Tax=candidate division WOR-3 bacterium RBG_13_43_14 TaxID=1802590 RepID=A0A1F4U2Y3_UNCW3|nr:MAG: hypothetical protein A2Y85_08760 [candidate division WOR-3 bacterium RBG_13_43_14]